LGRFKDWVVRPATFRIEGAVESKHLGGFLKQYEVAIIQSRLKAVQVSPTESGNLQWRFNEQ